MFGLGFGLGFGLRFRLGFGLGFRRGFSLEFSPGFSLGFADICNLWKIFGHFWPPIGTKSLQFLLPFVSSASILWVISEN